jgi:S1-C subfamily serine protease
MIALTLAAAVASAQEAPRGWIGFRFCHYEPPTEGESGWIEVSEIAPGSPAEAAGLAVGDLIVELDGEALPWREAAEVAKFLRSQEAGTKLAFTLRRGVERLQLEITVAEPPR